MTSRITTTFPDALYAQVKALAKEGGESMAWLVERAVRREVERMQREQREQREETRPRARRAP